MRADHLSQQKHRRIGRHDGSRGFISVDVEAVARRFDDKVRHITPKFAPCAAFPQSLFHVKHFAFAAAGRFAAFSGKLCAARLRGAEVATARRYNTCLSALFLQCIGRTALMRELADVFAAPGGRADRTGQSCRAAYGIGVRV